MTFFLISSSFISSSIIIQLDACSSLCICIHILLITLLLHLWSNTSSLLLICPPQSFWRSYVARSRFMSLKKAAIATQCAWRGRVARKELRKLKMVRSSVVNGLTIFYFISYWCASAVFLLIPMSMHKRCLMNYQKRCTYHYVIDWQLGIYTHENEAMSSWAKLDL